MFLLAFAFGVAGGGGVEDSFRNGFGGNVCGFEGGTEISLCHSYFEYHAG